jgi:hypothetical protein
MPIGYPFANGDRFDASSIELTLNAKKYIGVKRIAYRQARNPGLVYGLSAQPLGKTRGTYAVEGTIQIYREEFQDLCVDLQQLAVGLLEANFLCTVTYSEVDPLSGKIPTGGVGSTSRDELIGMNFTATEHAVEGGSNEPLVVELPFMAMVLNVHGIPPLAGLMRVAQVAAS